MLAWVRFVEKVEKQKSPAENKTKKDVLEGKKRGVEIGQSPLQRGASKTLLGRRSDLLFHKLNDREVPKGGVDRGIQNLQGQNLLHKIMMVLGRAIVLILCLFRLLSNGLHTGVH